jgi:hypothetical protein
MSQMNAALIPIRVNAANGLQAGSFVPNIKRLNVSFVVDKLLNNAYGRLMMRTGFVGLFCARIESVLNSIRKRYMMKSRWRYLYQK